MAQFSMCKQKHPVGRTSYAWNTRTKQVEVDTAAGKTGGLLLFSVLPFCLRVSFTVAGYSTTAIFVNPVSLLNKMSEAHDLSVQLCTDVQT